MKKVQGNKFYVDQEQAWEDLGEGISRKIMGYDNAVMAVKMRYEENSMAIPHLHKHSQISHVSAGKFEVTIGEEVKTLSAGDSFYVPSNMLHAVVCIEQGELIDTFSPYRAEFLAEQ
ncbi:cupin domain-containing protein [Persicobacter psychrovividus]|uniref:Cupin n=1 Tax=Persicobacter psychrovividus TaxID=387638 RepID=A0ABM7VJ93_9BACT|nr:cupin [Persicobacter psychrovividus]